MNRRLLTVIILLLSGTTYAQDWSSCEYDLSGVKSAANNANYYAADLDRLNNNYVNCLQYPSTYDLMNDNCESYRSDYNRKLSEFDSEMNELLRKLKNSLFTCSYD